MNFRPLLVVPCLIEASHTTFLLPKQEVEIKCSRNFLRVFVRLCDGTRDHTTIIRILGRSWGTQYVQSVIQALRERGVLLDSRNITPLVWEFVQNPSPWSSQLTEEQIHNLVFDQHLQRSNSRNVKEFSVRSNRWTRLIAKRASVRSFGVADLSQDAIIRMLWSANGETNSIIDQRNSNKLMRRTVASAGALYPLSVYLVIFRAIGKIQEGVYRVTFRSDRVRFCRIHGNVNRFRRSFLQPEIVQSACGAIILCGSFERSTAKYANRGLLYTLLEAGQATQNAVLSALQDRIATVEIGGFIEADLSVGLRLKQSATPLISLFFGPQPSRSKKRQASAKPVNEEVIVREVQFVPRRIQQYSLPFSMAFGRVTSDAGAQQWWSCGRSRNPQIAKLKATAEGIEWFAASRSRRRKLVKGSMQEFQEQAIDPRLMHPYLPWQLSNVSGITPFNTKVVYEWFPVENIMSNEKKLVLADFVFYPYEPISGRRYAYANSSGYAAHVSVTKATERGLLELVERDAFMVTWFNRMRRRRIARGSLPDSIQRRLRDLRKLGFDVAVLDNTYDLMPCPLVVAVNQSMPYLTCSSASEFDLEQALDRALMEVEGSIYCRLRDGKTRRVLNPEDVWEVHDRDLLYQQQESLRRAQFLLGDDRHPQTLVQIERQKFPKTHQAFLEVLRQKGYSVFVANLSSGDDLLSNLTLKVVKTFVPGMVPMSFEYKLDAIGLPRSKLLPGWCGYRRSPLPTDRLNTYPHPYT